MEPYRIYGHFYDATQDQPDGQYYLHLLRKHCPHATLLLEVACGTGSHLLPLSKHYQVTGLDISSTMLSYARQRLPMVRFYRQDMAGFRVQGMFDAIVCPYDSINQILRFGDWVRTFQSAKIHLAPKGVFIFDANTERRLQELVNSPGRFDRFGRHYVAQNVSDAGYGVTDWDIKVFERLQKDKFRLHHEIIKERAFAHDRVMTALKRVFREVRAYDGKGWSRPKKTSKRLFYVCTQV